MYNCEFECAKNLAKKVGDFLIDQEIKSVNSLSGRDIKLKLDQDAEAIILTELKSSFKHAILSEEIGVVGEIKSNKPYWIIDPIDGTMNYSRDCPLACVSIALWVNEDPIFGVVYDFYRQELFSGMVGKGAWLNGLVIKPSGINEKSNAILATGFPTYLDLNDENLGEFMMNVRRYKKIRMFGTAALSLCYLASGRVDGYHEKNIKLWDIAAGIAINAALNIEYKIINLQNYSTDTSVGV